MTKEELLVMLRQLATDGDIEIAHMTADEGLLMLIGDDEITAAFLAIKKWYA